MTLSQTDLEFVRRFVAERSAIVLEPSKDYLIESRIATLAATEQLADASAVVAAARNSPAGVIGKKLVEAMTTNETSFFRDRLPFDALRDTVLPSLIAARSAQRRIRIWSAASSTGQEPYSIAMLIRDHFPELGTWDVRILATDLSSEALEKAQSGRYSQLEVGRGLPAPALLRHFDQDGTRWTLRPTVRDMVTFEQLNLMAPWPSVRDMDVVFLRNVMIYFDPSSKEQILRNVARILRPDGYLFLGAGENVLNLNTPFVREDVAPTCAYRHPQTVGTTPATPTVAPPIGAIGGPATRPTTPAPATPAASTTPGSSTPTTPGVTRLSTLGGTR